MKYLFCQAINWFYPDMQMRYLEQSEIYILICTC